MTDQRVTAMKFAPALLLCALSAVVAAPASAQPNQSGSPAHGVQQPAYGIQQGVSSGYTYDSHITPTLRRQKVELILALREEAGRLQAQDGGTLSPKNLAYIRRKAVDICYSRSGRGMPSACPTGTLR